MAENWFFINCITLSNWILMENPISGYQGRIQNQEFGY